MVRYRYTPDEKRLPSELKKIQQSIRDSHRPTGTEREQTLLNLIKTQEDIQEAVLELQARSSHLATPSNLTLVYGTGWGQKGPATRTFTFPAPQGGRRVANIVGSGSFEWAGGSAPDALGIYLRAELWLGSVLVNSDTANVSNAPFIPAAFSGNTLSLVEAVRIPAGANPSFELRLYGYRSADGGAASDAGRLGNLNFTLQYGDKY